MKPALFWCPGRGVSRVSTFDKPERYADVPAEWCQKFKAHGPHAWVPRGKVEASGASYRTSR